MPAPQYSYENFNVNSVATPNAAEGIVCTTRPVNSPYNGAQFSVTFIGYLTVGATTTSVTFKIRQQSLTGTQVANYPAVVFTAAQNVLCEFACVDGSLTEVAGFVWVLTAQQNAGTAPGQFGNGYSRVATPV